MKNDNPWRTLASKITYKNPWMTVYEDKVQMPNGGEGIYGFIDGKPGIFIIALTNDEKIYLIESFRYPTQKWQWELPTGGIDKDLTPLEAAQHELAEELGMIAAKWTHVNKIRKMCLWLKSYLLAVQSLKILRQFVLPGLLHLARSRP